MVFATLTFASAAATTAAAASIAVAATAVVAIAADAIAADAGLPVLAVAAHRRADAGPPAQSNAARSHAVAVELPTQSVPDHGGAAHAVDEHSHQLRRAEHVDFLPPVEDVAVVPPRSWHSDPLLPCSGSAC